MALRQKWRTRLVIPDQIVDYTYGRAHTFYEDGLTRYALLIFRDRIAQRYAKRYWMRLKWLLLKWCRVVLML